MNNLTSTTDAEAALHRAPTESAVRPVGLADIEQALDQGEFVLYYQPKVNMRSGKVIGVEALLRWQHPERGLVLPGDFLPQIENHDLIVELGHWVMRQALQQIAQWRKQRVNISVSVNLAARQLQHSEFVQCLKGCLLDFPDAPPEQLEIEILESAALEDIAHVQQVMDACREMGISFALDDFGTGYSSLAYLRKIPAEVLKIDRGFINDLLDDSDDMILVEGVIGLAKSFRRIVVAEGVESSEHGLLLMRLGCDIAQGFGIARPMPAENIPDWVTRYCPDPQWMLWADIPWEMEDFPLLVAKYDHITWVKRVLATLDGDTLHLQQDELTNHHKCRFGHWYYHQGKARYGHMRTFVDLEHIHARVHQLGPEIVREHAAGNQTAALSLAKELLEVRDSILQHLDDLQRSVLLDPGNLAWREKPARPGEDIGSQPLSAKLPAMPRKHRQPVILVVDDTPTNIELLAGALSSDYGIKFATSGARALELLDKPGKPDLILLDVMMPGMDGFEVCRRLKSNPATRSIPVMFITAKNEAADQAHGFNLGAVDYIAKPFELPVVLARVRTHLNLKLRTDLLEAESSIDALTGIGNRRRFDDVLRTEWKRAARTSTPLSMLMFDIDHFDVYNTQYGYGAGEECLRQIGVALQNAELRPGDFIARYESETFAVVLPNCRAVGAEIIAEQIRSLIESLHIPHAHSPTSPYMTVSIGAVTQKPVQGGDVSSLFVSAGVALTRAKEKGRNQASLITL